MRTASLFRHRLVAGLVGLTVLLIGAGLVLSWAFNVDRAGGPVVPPGPAVALGQLIATENRESLPERWEFRFPDDHGPHPRQRLEYWLLLLWLTDERGEQYDVQLGFYRAGLDADVQNRQSEWAVDQMYRAHWLVFGPDDQYGAERFSRAALGLSGASQDPLQVWVEDWRLSRNDAGGWQVSAAENKMSMQLTLSAAGTMQAIDSSIARLGGRRAFFAYQQPLTQVSGDLTLAGRRYAVQGSAWLEHVWGNLIPAAGGQLTLNRWLLPLATGDTLYCAQLRRRDGGGTPLGECVWHRADGGSQTFGRREIALTPLDYWQSPQNLGRYPVAWGLTIAAADIELRWRAVEPDALQRFAIPLWAGPVVIEGTVGGEPVNGRGYQELSGYRPAPGT